MAGLPHPASDPACGGEIQAPDRTWRATDGHGAPAGRPLMPPAAPQVVIFRRKSRSWQFLYQDNCLNCTGISNRTCWELPTAIPINQQNRETEMSTQSERAKSPQAKSHQTVVTDQFGPRAAAYIASAVHATGEDLQQLASLVRGQSQARVLDLGCGGGHVSFAVAPEVREVVAYDLSTEMLTAVTRAAVDRGLDNLKTECGAVEKLPFADASFGVVMTRFSAHHWRDLDAALAEARRVIRPSGFAAFVDVVTPGEPLLATCLQSIEM